jgi:hypothetical protein
MYPDSDADFHHLYHSAKRLREISWEEELDNLSVLADSLSALLGACPSHKLKTITLRLNIPIKRPVITKSEEIATHRAWARLCETLQDPKFRGLKRFNLEISTRWFILLEDPELDTAEFVDVQWLEPALAPLRAAGVLVVSVNGWDG